MGGCVVGRHSSDPERGVQGTTLERGSGQEADECAMKAPYRFLLVFNSRLVKAGFFFFFFSVGLGQET